MSYVGAPYDHDVFVSYAHGVTVRDVAPLKRWSHCLVDELEATILNTQTAFTDALDIFIDRDLDPTRQLTPYLRERVERSALLLIVMSPFYLRSAWCGDEVRWFEAWQKQRGRSDGYFFIARALPTTAKDWPTYLKDERGHTLPGFGFHPEPATDTTTAHGWYYPRVENPRHWPFYEQLENLSGAITRRLKEVRGQLERQRQAPPAAVSISSLYLHARPEHADVWCRTRQVLEAVGFQVWPKEPVKAVATSETMQQARLARLLAYKKSDALLILRPDAGAWIEQEIATTGHNERAELKALASKHLPCAVIDQVGDGVPIARDFGIGVVAATIPAWVPALQTWLATAAAEAAGSA